VKILFVHNHPSSFVKIDLAILKESHEVEELYLKNKLSIAPIKIWKAVYRNELIFGWFSSWHTFLPILIAKIFLRPVILITGGYDTANLPSSQYGNQRKYFSRLITNWNIKKSDIIICNSNFIKEEVIKNTGVKKDKIEVVYHGIPNYNLILGNKENIILNIGNVSNINLYRKGILSFVKAATLLDNFQFIQVGRWMDDSYKSLQQIAGKNVQIKGYLSDIEMTDLMSRSKYYLQPSLHEGFGMSVAESMQHGCIPIVSASGALPEVVGQFGIILKDITPKTIKESIEEAELTYAYNAKSISSYIIENFNIDIRRKKFEKIIFEFAKN